MSTLSVVIPTKNVAALIGECLQSVAWADEVIVVDMASTDGTPEMARKFPNVKVISNLPPDGNFTLNRQLGFERAAGDWILKLDSDERLTPELQAELKSFMLTGSGVRERGYYFPVRLFMFGKFVSHGLPSGEIRLFRKDSYSYGPEIHGQIKINGPTGYFKNSYVHYNHRSIYQWIDKMNFYTEADMNLSLKKGRRQPLWKILITPACVFFESYFIRRGFLEGVHGYLIASLLAYYSFIEKAKLWEARYKLNHPEPG